MNPCVKQFTESFSFQPSSPLKSSARCLSTMKISLFSIIKLFSKKRKKKYFILITSYIFSFILCILPIWGNLGPCGPIWGGTGAIAIWAPAVQMYIIAIFMDLYAVYSPLFFLPKPRKGHGMGTLGFGSFSL